MEYPGLGHDLGRSAHPAFDSASCSSGLFPWNSKPDSFLISFPPRFVTQQSRHSDSTFCMCRFSSRYAWGSDKEMRWEPWFILEIKFRSWLGIWFRMRQLLGQIWGWSGKLRGRHELRCFGGRSVISGCVRGLLTAALSWVWVKGRDESFAPSSAPTSRASGLGVLILVIHAAYVR